MSSHEIKAKNRRTDPNLSGDPMLEQALGNFRQSMHAWSAAAYNRPRSAVEIRSRHSWRFAVGWALGCVLVSGGVGGGLYERHHLRVVAQIGAEQEARQQQVKVQEHVAGGDEDLLAAVDKDISRTVPAAMEPLAQLMESDADQ